MAPCVLTNNTLGSGSDSKNKIGSGSDDWWTVYPEQSSAAASGVNHPQWVLDALEQKPVVIYVHKGCGYCRPQTEAMAEVVNDYGDQFAYFDMSAMAQHRRSNGQGLDRGVRPGCCKLSQ